MRSQDVGADRRGGLSRTSRGVTQASIGAYLRPEGLRRKKTLHPCHGSIRRAGDDAAAGSSYSQVVIFLFVHAPMLSAGSQFSHQCSRSYARSSYRARSISRPQQSSSRSAVDPIFEAFYGQYGELYACRVTGLEDF